MTPKKQLLRILVLSDVHYGKSWNKDFMPPNSVARMTFSNAISMRDNLVEVISRQKIDCIFVAGDLTSTGKPQDFELCKKVLEDISDKLHVPKNAVFLTYGNHDCDWKISKLGDEHEPADRCYDVIAGSVGPIIMGAAGMDGGPVPGCAVHEIDKMILFVLNSGYHSTHWQNYQHGRLGEGQLAWFKGKLADFQNSEKWKVLLLHHHPFNYTYPSPIDDISCLEEGAELVELAGKNGVHFICHGHRHQPRIFTAMQTGWTIPVTFFCAGSLAVGPDERAMGQIPNVFHVVQLDSQTDRGAAKGNVDTYRYGTNDGWTLNTYSSTAPLEGHHFFGGIATMNERKQMLMNVIKVAINDNDGKDVVDMPQLDKLDHDLRCMPIKELNLLVSDTVKTFSNTRVLGEYPSSVVLDRRHK